MPKVKDLTGQRFGKLTAIRPTDKRENGKIVWECLCDCGETAFVKSSALSSGNTQSCGCLRAKKLTGQRFGRLTAVRPTEKRKGSSVVWECKCDCGETAFVATEHLMNGDTQSCGCLRREKASKNRE